MKASDRIILRNVCAVAYVGVSEEERSDEQELVFDAELHLDLNPAAQSDNLSSTVDYLKVVHLLQVTSLAQPYKLLETLVEEAAEALLDQCPIECVVLRVRKMKLYGVSETFSATIEVTRLAKD
jgi:dihydroneopterin aldolase